MRLAHPVEGRHEHQRDALDDGRDEACDQAHVVVEGQPAHNHVVRRELDRRAIGRHLVEHRRVGQHHTLLQAGAAGRVLQKRRIAGQGRLALQVIVQRAFWLQVRHVQDRAERRNAVQVVLERAEHVRVGDDGLDRGQLHQGAHALIVPVRIELGRQEREDRRDGAQQHRSPEPVQHIGSVLEREHDEIVGLHARFLERAGVTGGLVEKLAVGNSMAFVGRIKSERDTIGHRTSQDLSAVQQCVWAIIHTNG